MAVVAWALVWPLAWIGYTLAHGAATGWYPYDFLDVSALGYAVALRNLAFVVLLAAAFLLLFRFVDRRLPATADRPLPGPVDHAGTVGAGAP
jgi:TRAP-type C4-dicarboxylate transport system permease small subunit